MIKFRHYINTPIDKIEMHFLKTQNLQPFIWFRYTDDIEIYFFLYTFLFCTQENSLNKFIEELNQFLPNLRFTNETSKEKVALYHDEVVKNLFTLPPIISYCSAKNTSSYLVQAKWHSLGRKAGCYKGSNPRCLVCESIKENDKINHHLDFNDKCLIYLLSCKVCKK